MACQFEDVALGSTCDAEFGGVKDCRFDFEMVINADELSQHNIIVEVEGGSTITFAVKGTNGNRTTEQRFSGALKGMHKIVIKADPCVKILKLTVWDQK